MKRFVLGSALAAVIGTIGGGLVATQFLLQLPMSPNVTPTEAQPVAYEEPVEDVFADPNRPMKWDEIEEVYGVSDNTPGVDARTAAADAAAIATAAAPAPNLGLLPGGCTVGPGVDLVKLQRIIDSGVDPCKLIGFEYTEAEQIKDLLDIHYYRTKAQIRAAELEASLAALR